MAVSDSIARRELNSPGGVCGGQCAAQCSEQHNAQQYLPWPPPPSPVPRGAGLSVVQSECSSLEGPLSSVDPEADLAPFWEVAASAVRTGDALSARQAETLGQISGELLASPHIVRWAAGFCLIVCSMWRGLFSEQDLGGRGGPSGWPCPIS